MRLGERARAIASFRAALELAPEDTDVMRELSTIYALGGERDEQLRIAEELAHRRRELHRSVIEREAHLVATQDQLDAEQTEISRIDLREGHLVADIEADRSKMAARRWADDAPHNGEPL